MKKRIVLSCFILFLVTAPAMSVLAGEVEEMDFRLDTTRDLYDLCSVDPDDQYYVPAIYACRAFIEGAVQYHDGVSDRTHLKRLICYPSTATIEDGRREFVKWSEINMSNDELMQEQPVVGLVRALSKAYPCPE